MAVANRIARRSSRRTSWIFHSRYRPPTTKATTSVARATAQVDQLNVLPGSVSVSAAATTILPGTDPKPSWSAALDGGGVAWAPFGVGAMETPLADHL